MNNICIYIFGFVIGVFILITLLRYDILYTSKNKDLNDEISVDADNNNIERFIVDDKILEDYNEEDENNLIKCNVNILNNFKIDRLLKKHYLITLISSYNRDNYNTQSKIWTLDNKNKINNKGENSVKVDVNPEYIHFPLKPTVGGFNINKSSIEIMPKYMKKRLGMVWEEFSDIPNNFIEIKDNVDGYEKLKKELESGQTKFTLKMISEFPEILYNNYRRFARALRRRSERPRCRCETAQLGNSRGLGARTRRYTRARRDGRDGEVDANASLSFC